MKKKILAMLLVLVMLLGMLPMGALAAEGDAITIETGHAASYPADMYLSKIVLQGVSGTLTGSNQYYEVVLAEGTATTQPITIELTGSLGVAAAQQCYFYINGEKSEKVAAEKNYFSLSTLPEWSNGRATVVVGLGNDKKISVKYTLELSISGLAKENCNKVRL